MTKGQPAGATATTTASLDVLAEHAPIALLQLDTHMVIQAINPAAEALLGASARTLAGQTMGDSFVESTALTTLLSFAFQTGGDVSAPDIEIRSSLLQPALRLTVRIKNAGPDGLVVALSQPMTHEREDGVPGVAGMGRILGHEVKNPLAGISGAAQLMLRRGREEDAELLALIRDEAGRIERLINRFSAFELYSRPQLKPENIHEILDRVVNTENAAFGGKVVYHREYDPSLPAVLVDSDHLHEALLNVLRNGAEAAASQHAGEGQEHSEEQAQGQITVSTAFEMNAPVAPRTGAVARRAIRIDITDNGPGIDPAKIEGLFEAFESSKASGRGLGLTVVKEVIAAHGGHVLIHDPAPDRIGKGPGEPTGTRVSIYLPIKRKAYT